MPPTNDDAGDARRHRRPRLHRQDDRSASTVRRQHDGHELGWSTASPCTAPLPANGVIYVKTDTGGCGTLTAAVERELRRAASCGNLYVSGTYTESMTLAAANDIIVAPPRPPGPTRPDTATCIALRQRRHGPHRDRTSCASTTRAQPQRRRTVMKSVRIDAAILSLAHSFTVDNHDCGSQLGSLTVNGAIAQKYRGAGRHRPAAPASSRTTTTTTGCATAARRTSSSRSRPAGT